MEIKLRLLIMQVFIPIWIALISRCHWQTPYLPRNLINGSIPKLTALFNAINTFRWINYLQKKEKVVIVNIPSATLTVYERDSFIAEPQGDRIKGGTGTN